jgi:hypothetical protein
MVGMQAQLIERVVPRRLDQTSALFRGASESFVARLMIRMARRPLRAMPGQCIVAQVPIPNASLHDPMNPYKQEIPQTNCPLICIPSPSYFPLSFTVDTTTSAFTTILLQGTYGDEMYLVKSGAVEISVRDPRTNKVSHNSPC